MREPTSVAPQSAVTGALASVEPRPPPSTPRGSEPYSPRQLSRIQKGLARSWTTATCPTCHRIFHAVMRTTQGRRGYPVWLVRCATCQKRAVLPARSGDWAPPTNGWTGRGRRGMGGLAGWLRMMWPLAAVFLVAWATFTILADGHVRHPPVPFVQAKADGPSLQRRVAIDPPGWRHTSEYDLGPAPVDGASPRHSVVAGRW